MSREPRIPGALAREIAAILRAALARQQREQTEIAAATGISEGQISKLFAGKKPFDIEDLDKIARALRLNLTEEIINPADKATQGRIHPR
jgi:transcriptional regulator with XRE-family HTH domain